MAKPDKKRKKKLKKLGLQEKILPVLVGRVVHEDEQFLTLEIAKDLSERVTLKDGDRFYTLMFTEGLPWKKKKEEPPT